MVPKRPSLAGMKKQQRPLAAKERKKKKKKSSKILIEEDNPQRNTETEKRAPLPPKKPISSLRRGTTQSSFASGDTSQHSSPSRGELVSLASSSVATPQTWLLDDNFSSVEMELDVPPPPLLEKRPSSDHGDPDSASPAHGNRASSSAKSINSGGALKPQVPVRGECQCCFDSVLSTNNYISCTPAAETQMLRTTATQSECNISHKFCRNCVRRYVETWLFGGVNYEISEFEIILPCLSTECTEGRMDHEAIQKALVPSHPQLWEQYQEKVFQLISLKGQDSIRDLSAMVLHGSSSEDSADPLRFPNAQQETAELQDSDSDLRQSATVGQPLARKKKKKKERKGRNDSRTKQDAGSDEFSAVCRVVSTKQEEEPTAERKLSVRHQVEEAMTEAKIRSCPKCRLSFLKETGCNKMKCPNCRTRMCYICRQVIQDHGYTHFCLDGRRLEDGDTCPKRCGKCPLWTNLDDETDSEQVRAAAQEEANRLWEQILLDPTQSEEFEADHVSVPSSFQAKHGEGETIRQDSNPKTEDDEESLDKALARLLELTSLDSDDEYKEGGKKKGRRKGSTRSSS